MIHLGPFRVLGQIECIARPFFPMGFNMVLIREYDPTADYPALHASFVELQAWEQSFEPGLPAPDEAAVPYLAEVFRSCAENSGRIFLAEADGAVVGFVCVLAKVPPSADDGHEPYAYISDLVVRASNRGRGIGRELMVRAESFARELGAKQLKVGVLVRNEATHAFYRSGGFRDYTVQLVKPLNVEAR
jgi:ribosomal protein S18 acetylase RimI-like enzyme